MRMKTKSMTHGTRFNGMKSEKFSMLTMLKNGGIYIKHADIARLLGINERTLQAWLADDEYLEVERLYKQVQEDGDRLDIEQVEELIAWYT